MNKPGQINRILFVIKKIYALNRKKVYSDILYQFVGKFRMFIFAIFYPLFIFTAIENGLNFSTLVIYVGTALAVNLLIDLYLGWYNNHGNPINNLAIMETINQEINRQSVRVDISCYENDAFYDTFFLTRKNTSEFFLGLYDSVLSSVFDCLYIALTIALMVRLDAVVVIFVAIPLFVSFIAGSLLNSEQYRYNTVISTEDRKKEFINNALFRKEYAKEIRLTRILKVISDFGRDVFKRKTEAVRAHGVKIASGKAVVETLGRYASYIFALIYITCIIVVTGTLSISEFYFLLLSIITLSWYLSSTIRNVLAVIDRSRYIEHYIQFMALEPVIKSGDKPIETPIRKIEFRNVTFRYPGAANPALKNISFVIDANQKIALVGYNGAGKTTIINLLLRYYQPDRGEILINGHDIKSYELNGLRDDFALVFQNPQIYALPIHRNISMSSDYDESQVEYAVRKGGINDIVSSVPEGLRSELTREFDENGIVLSGGQRQKVAIARALYGEKSIAVFDEPSSFLDPFSEREIFTSLVENSKNRIVIFVSHRLSAANLADRILYIENGELTEYGKHDELMRARGKYRDLFVLQAQNYLDMESKWK